MNRKLGMRERNKDPRMPSATEIGKIGRNVALDVKGNMPEPVCSNFETSKLGRGIRSHPTEIICKTSLFHCVQVRTL